jgi:hypothetical protein
MNSSLAISPPSSDAVDWLALKCNHGKPFKDAREVAAAALELLGVST